MADLENAYAILKARLDRGGLSVPEAQETYWRQRLQAAVEELAKKGIHIESTQADTMLLADFTAYKIQNRDKPDEMPKWLRLELRERFLSQKRGQDAIN